MHGCRRQGRLVERRIGARAGGAWIVRDVIGGGDVAIASLGLAIPLAEIYA